MNINLPDKQLHKKFRHAPDFGVSGNLNKGNVKKFAEAIKSHILNPNNEIIVGTYRGNPAIFHVEPDNGLTVIQKPNGDFWSGWVLNSQQLRYVLENGKLGGG